MNRISVELLTPAFSESVGEVRSKLTNKSVHWRVTRNEYASESVSPAAKGALCSFCGTEKGDNDLIIAGHPVLICLECFASLNTSEMEQSVCGQNWPPDLSRCPRA